MTFRLVQCDVNGHPMEPIGPLSEFVAENCVGGAALYASVGFVPPWVGYIAVDGMAEDPDARTVWEWRKAS